MKRALIITIALLCAIFVFGTAYADGAEGTVEISFKVGDDVLKINGRDVKVEKPFVVDGTTLVPVRVITEAFGAQVGWNEKERSITLLYEGKEMKLVLDSKEAIIDGKKATLLAAPVLVGDKTMVPLRFISENFGAEVTYEEATQFITVTKYGTSGDGIKDFSSVLGKITKERVGDSYYNWSIALPSEMEVYYKEFNGTYVWFATEDWEYDLEVSIESQQNETLDSLMTREIADVSDYSIISYGKEKKNGQEFIRIVYKDSESGYETRVYVNDGKIYTLKLEVYDYNQYKDNSLFTEMLDSFKLAFGDKENTDDLSNVNEDGLRLYINEGLRWEIAVPAEWGETHTAAGNKVSFENPDAVDVLMADSLSVSMFSREEGLTLNNWVEDERKKMRELYNPELVKLIKVEDLNINGVPAKAIHSSIKINITTYYGCDVYIVGQDYRYQLGYIVQEETYHKEKDLFDKVIKSFKINNPDVSVIGTLLDPDKILYDQIANQPPRKIQNKDYKWSFELPAIWMAGAGNNDKTYVSYSCYAGNINLVLNVEKNKSMDEMVKEFKSGLEGGSLSQVIKYTLDSEQTLSEKGTKVKKFNITFTAGEVVGNNICYILSKNGYVYTVYFSISELMCSEKNLKMLDNIWKSMKFE